MDASVHLDATNNSNTSKRGDLFSQFFSNIADTLRSSFSLGKSDDLPFDPELLLYKQQKNSLAKEDREISQLLDNPTSDSPPDLYAKITKHISQLEELWKSSNRAWVRNETAAENNQNEIKNAMNSINEYITHSSESQKNIDRHKYNIKSIINEINEIIQKKQLIKGKGKVYYMQEYIQKKQSLNMQIESAHRWRNYHLELLTKAEQSQNQMRQDYERAQNDLSRFRRQEQVHQKKAAYWHQEREECKKYMDWWIDQQAQIGKPLIPDSPSYCPNSPMGSFILNDTMDLNDEEIPSYYPNSPTHDSRSIFNENNTLPSSDSLLPMDYEADESLVPDELTAEEKFIEKIRTGRELERKSKWTEEDMKDIVEILTNNDQHKFKNRKAMIDLFNEYGGLTDQKFSELLRLFEKKSVWDQTKTKDHHQPIYDYLVHFKEVKLPSARDRSEFSKNIQNSNKGANQKYDYNSSFCSFPINSINHHLNMFGQIASHEHSIVLSPAQRRENSGLNLNQANSFANRFGTMGLGESSTQAGRSDNLSGVDQVPLSEEEKQRRLALLATTEDPQEIVAGLEIVYKNILPIYNSISKNIKHQIISDQLIHTNLGISLRNIIDFWNNRAKPEYADFIAKNLIYIREDIYRNGSSDTARGRCDEIFGRLFTAGVKLVGENVASGGVHTWKLDSYKRHSGRKKRDNK